jgi:hypothetical protein
VGKRLPIFVVDVRHLFGAELADSPPPYGKSFRSCHGYHYLSAKWAAQLCGSLWFSV